MLRTRALSSVLLLLVGLASQVAQAHVGETVRLGTPNGPRRFVLQERLGNGASSQTYRAVEPTTGWEVAVKLQREGAKARWKTGFEREHAILARTVAPQVMRSFGIGVLEGPEPKPAMVLELARGRDLNKTAWVGPWPVNLAARTMMQMLRGVRAIHQAGLRHNDLHLGNVRMVDGQPETLKIMDLSEASEATDPFRYWKSRWVAPERIEGAPSYGRTNADLYSVAVNLAILLTGMEPSNPAMWQQIPNLTAAYPNGQPVRLRDVVWWGLNPDPAKRFQTAQQMINALRPFSR